RAELRDALTQGKFGRELLALEPLLDDFDGAEIAAAALQLLERERHARAALEAASATRREPSSMVRLFISVGSRDNARPADLVGAIANQGGVSSSEIGKVDLRESHSVVEVSANVADAIIERVNGTTIKGRRAIVRRDEGVEGRGGMRGDRGDRGERGDRPAGRPRDRGGPPRRDRGDRGERGERPERGARPGRSERPGRRGGGDRE